MDENPYKAPDPEASAPKRPTTVKLLLAFCIAVTVIRSLTLVVGGLRVLLVPERRENTLAILAFVIWPTLAVVIWAATAAAVWRSRWGVAVIGSLIGLCDLIALAIVQSPIAM